MILAAGHDAYFYWRAKNAADYHSTLTCFDEITDLSLNTAMRHAATILKRNAPALG